MTRVFKLFPLQCVLIRIGSNRHKGSLVIENALHDATGVNYLELSFITCQSAIGGDDAPCQVVIFALLSSAILLRQEYKFIAREF